MIETGTYSYTKDKPNKLFEKKPKREVVAFSRLFVGL